MEAELPVSPTVSLIVSEFKTLVANQKMSKTHAECASAWGCLEEGFERQLNK